MSGRWTGREVVREGKRKGASERREEEEGRGRVEKEEGARAGEANQWTYARCGREGGGASMWLQLRVCRCEPGAAAAAAATNTDNYLLLLLQLLLLLILLLVLLVLVLVQVLATNGVTSAAFTRLTVLPVPPSRD